MFDVNEFNDKDVKLKSILFALCYKDESTETQKKTSSSDLDLNYKVASHAEIYNFVVEVEF